MTTELVTSILVKVLLSDGIPENVKEWLRKKLKALASLLGRLGMKVAEALFGIIVAIISWILNKAKEVVGWISQNLCMSFGCRYWRVFICTWSRESNAVSVMETTFSLPSTTTLLQFQSCSKP